MKSEIKIILEPNSSNFFQGSCFENLVRNILHAHQYMVKSNINFSGMEIDLMAEHKINKEKLYVECKAKDKVSSTEISKFAFNVEFKEADKGYFIRTKELDHQAGGLVEELKAKSKYKNLTFIEPETIIQILKDSNRIHEPDMPNGFNVTKRIFCVTYEGDFLLYIGAPNSTIPSHFLLYEAKSQKQVMNPVIIDLILENIDETSKLNHYIPASNQSTISLKSDIENISEVQESENWFDYLPASSRHFIGRDKLRSSIFDFFNNVTQSKTKRRIFYLTGKSGWGKSSLVAEIRGRCRNKHYKRKYYTYAVDTRSATSPNFVAIAFEKLLRKAQEEGFIEGKNYFKSLSFTSSFDLLSSKSVLDILQELRIKNRVLILIFDQFEDVFRKEGLFKSFYKFLSDVTDKQENIIVGFSWKTEILIPSENAAYHYWQQAKEQAEHFQVSEFGGKEIDGVSNQLETSIKALGYELKTDLKRRIKENSQGLPWLTKKLCIHIYEQICSGVNPDKLSDENLNIEILFNSDLEKLNAEEVSALKYIAKKAYDGNFFDVSDVNDTLPDTILDSLRDKRLIIRSGIHYNIYWDIFRDYLVTGDVPSIGESYILRQSVKVCQDIFLLFPASNYTISIETLIAKCGGSKNKQTIENTLIELRNLGLVQKLENDTYSISSDISVSKEAFCAFINSKFKNYTPIKKLDNLKTAKINKEDIVSVLKGTFKYDFKEKTWEVYANYLIGWINVSDQEVKKRINVPLKGRKRSYDTFSQTSKDIILKSKKDFERGLIHFKETGKLSYRLLLEFFILGIIDDKNNVTEEGSKILSQDVFNALISISEKILQIPKMRTAKMIWDNYQNAPIREIAMHFPDDFFGRVKRSSKELYVGKILSWFRV